MSSVKSFVALSEKYDRIVVLIDMDCFYCQVEEYLDPGLANKPIGETNKTLLELPTITKCLLQLSFSMSKMLGSSLLTMRPGRWVSPVI